jgi:hypothetical protein
VRVTARDPAKLKAFVQVRCIPLAWLLLPIALGKNDNIAGRNLSSRAAIPPAMKHARSSKYSEGVPVSIISEPNIVNRSHCSFFAYKCASAYFFKADFIKSTSSVVN